jgi:hypothetical protein
VLDPVVIGQDDLTELHVQAVIQGGRRHLDIRVWRRGPTGFAPSRNALTLDAADLDALQEGITELLEASDGGRQVARVVWDKDEGRRLRAETEPFGTRFLARLGFWQRVRDSWKPVGEGLVLAADRLIPLQALLRDLRPRLEPDVATTAPVALEIEHEEDGQQAWPVPGPDWITIEAGRVALHPLGTRITSDVEEDEQGAHHLVFHQWKRPDNLWLTEDSGVRLNLTDLDRVLTCVRRLAESEIPPEDAPGQRFPIADGSTLWVRIASLDPGPELRLDVLPPAEAESDSGAEQRLSLPAGYVPHFGRMLWQSRIILISHLSRDEREALLSAEELAEIMENAQTRAAGQAESIAAAEAANGSTSDRSVDQDRVVLEEATMVAWKPEQPAPEPPLPEQAPGSWAVSVGDVKLGQFHVFFFLPEAEPRRLAIQWEGRSLQLPIDHLAELTGRVRDLYYDTLRGRRGRAVTIGTRPAVTISVHHHGTTSFLALDQEIDGKTTHLSFPTQQVPAFLNVAEAALTQK